MFFILDAHKNCSLLLTLYLFQAELWKMVRGLLENNFQVAVEDPLYHQRFSNSIELACEV